MKLPTSVSAAPALMRLRDSRPSLGEPGKLAKLRDGAKDPADLNFF